MKRTKPAKRLSLLFARYYLAFTLALIAIFFGFYHIWDRYYGELLHIPDPDALLCSAEFESGAYASVDVQQYLGPSGGFAVMDSQGQLLYSSASQIPAIRTEEQLLCIPEYSSGEMVSATSFRTKDGQQGWIVTRELPLDDGETQTEVMVLDQDLEVLDGSSLIPGKTSYTQRELELMTNSWSEQYILFRQEALDSSGTPMTVLFLLPRYSEADYQTAFDKAGRLWLLTIPLYCAVTLLFIVLLNRHFRRPLTRLGDAIRRLGAGEPVSAGACGGPAEIQELGRSFDSMARKLAESQEETRRLEQQRIKMLTDISHDLKTPITVISGYIGAIRDGKVSGEELPQYLEIIGKKADSLTELINSFYEYSRTEHPDFRLEPVETDLCEFLREYLADKFNEIDLAGFSLEVDIPETLRLPCRLDPFQMRRALDNILGNSLRHNRLGTRLRVSVIRHSSAVLLRLADNGSGIPEELRRDLFTPFTVGDQSRSKGGSGLGLAISRKIIEAHGWTLRLSPDTGPNGTVFEIIIPQ